MSVRSRPVSVRSSQSAASSLALNAAQARADLAVAKARAEFNRRKAEANRARIEAEVEMDRLQIEQAVAAAQIRADTLETELQLLQSDNEGSALSELPVDEPDQRVVEWRNEEPVLNVVQEDTDTKSPVISQPSHPSHSESASHLLTAIGLGMNMPKPEISTFDGNHLEYWNFINMFEVNVASKAIDDRSKLTYLIQFCVGKARNSIANCVLLGGSEGYAEAKRILKEEFGQAHVIAKAHLSKVLNRPQVRPNDGKGLWDLARDMRRCQTVLSQMCYSADMNSSETLLRIQQLLPIHLQMKWAKKAYAMMEKLTTPDFKCMSSFVEEVAKLANNMYGQNIGGSYPKNTPKWKPNSKGITSLTTTTRRPEVSLTTETRLTCPACCRKPQVRKV
ncbi:uncharacterized protein LOC117118312 [Anneissia japonica]|uniref:uncharacterized protein LOC117118312 n=1 Tax=Anneissia japonica TaxID=1529436 RepID=UPI0014258B10|nr:uncharacterized protein LOC117118312 [Anneissia japonica]